MATIAEVAARAGVGVGTVSRVLNNSGHVSVKTRNKVLAVIDELNYRPNQLARALSLGQTLSIGVIVPFLTHPSTVERLRGIVETLRGDDYDLVLFNIDSPAHRKEHLPELTRPDRADGFLIISLPLEECEIAQLVSSGLPTVLVDTQHTTLPHVVIENAQGGYLATRHLLDLGHRRIAFIGDIERNPYGFTSSKQRRLGFQRALQEAGAPLQPEYIKAGPHGRHVAHRLTAELLALAEPPTAIFAASDTQALGVLEAVGQAGLGIPDDISVIGFDDIEVTAYVGLTTVRQPLYQSGARGAELLLSALHGEAIGAAHEVLPLELIARRTTAPPRS